MSTRSQASNAGATDIAACYCTGLYFDSNPQEGIIQCTVSPPACRHSRGLPTVVACRPLQLQRVLQCLGSNGNLSLPLVSLCLCFVLCFVCRTSASRTLW